MERFAHGVDRHRDSPRRWSARPMRSGARQEDRERASRRARRPIEGTHMILRIVTFKLHGVDDDTYRAHTVAIADVFNRWPGLRFKLWLADRTTGTYGGAYLFDGREAADASRASGAFAAMLANPSFVDLAIEEFDVLAEPTAVTAPTALTSGV
jgi:hypothetical protein